MERQYLEAWLLFSWKNAPSSKAASYIHCFELMTRNDWEERKDNGATDIKPAEATEATERGDWRPVAESQETT